jgi:hypothetical protein
MSTQQVSRISRISEATTVKTPQAACAADYISGVLARKNHESRFVVPGNGSHIPFITNIRQKMEAGIVRDMWFPSATSAQTLTQLAERYLKDIEVLSKREAECRAFFRSLLDARISTQHPLAAIGDIGLERALTDSRREFCESMIKFNVDHADNKLTAELCGESLGHVFRMCQIDIGGRVSCLAFAVLKELVSGVAEGLYGTLGWPSPTTCWYVRSEFELRFSEPSIQRDALTVIEKRNYEKHIALNEVHLVEARSLSTMPENLNWPRPLWNALAKMPLFLRPLARTVVGTMTKKRIIRWKIGDGVHIDVSKIPEPQNVPMRQPWFDPCVVIGLAVLGGWE